MRRFFEPTASANQPAPITTSTPSTQPIQIPPPPPVQSMKAAAITTQPPPPPPVVSNQQSTTISTTARRVPPPPPPVSPQPKSATATATATTTTTNNEIGEARAENEEKEHETTSTPTAEEEEENRLIKQEQEELIQLERNIMKLEEEKARIEKEIETSKRKIEELRKRQDARRIKQEELKVLKRKSTVASIRLSIDQRVYQHQKHMSINQIHHHHNQNHQHEQPKPTPTTTPPPPPPPTTTPKNSSSVQQSSKAEESTTSTSTTEANKMMRTRTASASVLKRQETVGSLPNDGKEQRRQSLLNDEQQGGDEGKKKEESKDELSVTPDYSSSRIRNQSFKDLEQILSKRGSMMVATSPSNTNNNENNNKNNNATVRASMSLNKTSRKSKKSQKAQSLESVQVPGRSSSPAPSSSPSPSPSSASSASSSQEKDSTDVFCREFDISIETINSNVENATLNELRRVFGFSWTSPHASGDLAIIDYLPIKPMSTEDKFLIQKYKTLLFHDRFVKKGLIKIFEATNWSDANEKRETLNLVEIVVHGTGRKLGIEEILAIFNSDIFYVPEIKDLAFESLGLLEDKIVEDVLLQLVQVLRWDILKENSPLVQILISKAKNNFDIASKLNWYLTVECQCPKMGEMFTKVHQRFLFACSTFFGKISSQQRFVSSLSSLCSTLVQSNESRPKKIQRLQKMLAETGPPFNWEKIFPEMLNPDSSDDDDVDDQRDVEQKESENATENATENETTTTTTSTQSPKNKANAASQNLLHHPVDPSILVKKIKSQDATIFKSAKSPLRLTFITQNNTEYRAIFKKGDDLRQDQLVIQLINLMDRVLRQEGGMDFRLSAYNVIATSLDDGFVECVPDSVNVSEVLEKFKEGGIQAFLKERHYSEEDPFGIRSEVLMNFVLSCAGYCVITFLLGIGDRHLDNLLITNDGKLFHIDFGFILGKDPKPFPPPMKLCKEMVEAMGGSASELYAMFKEKCFDAYRILRRHCCDLVMSMLLLMRRANIPQCATENLKQVSKVFEKFKIGSSDEEAKKYLNGVIDDSLRAVFPQITETFHKFAQNLRS